MRDFRTSDRDVAKRQGRARDGASCRSVRNPEEAKGPRSGGEAGRSPGVRGARRLAPPCRSPAEAKLKLPNPLGERNLLISRSLRDPTTQRTPLKPALPGQSSQPVHATNNPTPLFPKFIKPNFLVFPVINNSSYHHRIRLCKGR